MIIQILKAILVGICASAPLGPVAVLVIQKTLNFGRGTGFVTGIGSAVVDTLYALIGVFALSVINDFISSNEKYIYLIGGALVILVGSLMFFRKSMGTVKDVSHFTQAGYAVQAAGLALANPGAIALMLALMALFRVEAPSWVIVLSVSFGALFWWNLFAFVVDKFRGSLKVGTVMTINRALGIAIVIFGIVCILKVL